LLKKELQRERAQIDELIEKYEKQINNLDEEIKEGVEKLVKNLHNAVNLLLVVADG